MRVRVPGSIANIGPGFDCMAMAIDLWLEVEAEVADHPSWDFEGEGSEYLAAHDNPFSRIVTEQFDERLPNPGWGLAVFVARAPVPTEKARAVLPDSVPMDSAVYTAARTALLVRAITAKRPTLLEHALRDRIHQPHRLHLYPWTQDVMDAADRAGAYGSAICGAGPSVFAFCATSQALRVSRAMAGAAPHHGKPMVTRVTDKGMFRTL